MLELSYSLEMARLLVTSFLQLASIGRGGVRTFTSIHKRKTLLLSSSMKRTMAYSTYESGASNTLDFRMYFRKYRHGIAPLVDDECTISRVHFIRVLIPSRIESS